MAYFDTKATPDSSASPDSVVLIGIVTSDSSMVTRELAKQLASFPRRSGVGRRKEIALGIPGSRQNLHDSIVPATGSLYAETPKAHP